MKIYQGTPPGTVLIMEGMGQLPFRELPPRHDLFNHSPDGFRWGYGGSGPAQLALALLADALGDDERAVRLHQRFKWMFVAPLEAAESWAISDSAIKALTRTLRAQAAAEIEPPMMEE